MAELSFIFGKGQKARTPEEARRLREFAEALMGSQRAPQNVGEGLMALANGLSARFAHNAANRAAAEGRAGAESKVGPIFSALFGSNPVSPVTPSANRVAEALGGKKGGDGAGNLPSRFDFANAEPAGDLQPHQRALLNTISGPESGGSYDVIYGGSRFDDFSDHPRKYVTITSGPNKGKKSSAAGKYQFLGDTWDEYAGKLGLTDFKPRSQDRAAWALASDAYRKATGGDLDAVLQSGDPQAIAGVGEALAPIWTSLPGGIEQGTNTNRFVSTFDRNLRGGGGSEVARGGGGGAPLLAGRGGTDQLLGGAGNDALAPQQMPQIPQGIAPSRFDGPGSMGDPGVQAALAAERGQQPQEQGPGPLQAISRAFGFGGQPQPQSGPQAAPQPTAQDFPPQPPAPAAGDAGGNGALSMENLYRVLQDPWVEEGTKRVILSEIQRQQEMQDPAYQLGLEKSRLELEALRNPREKWEKLDDNTLFSPVSGETRNVGGQGSGTFRFQGNSVEAQALNGLMDSGALTVEQAQQLAAGKTVSGPNGEILFLTPQGVFGQQAGQPPQPIVPPAATGAPEASLPPQAAPQAAPVPQAAPQPAPAPAQPQQTGQRPGMISLTEPKTTIDERKAATFADRMKTSGEVLNDMEKAGTSAWDQTIRGNSWIPDVLENMMVSDGFQKFDQARRDFINAQLRRESGAVISDEEFDNANKQYFPQPGDTKEVLEQKRRNRQIVIDGMMRDAGPTYESGGDDPLGLGIRR